MKKLICIFTLLALTIIKLSAQETELLTNPDFNDGTNAWWAYGAEITTNNGEILFDISNAGTNAWDIQLGQENITLKQGYKYTLCWRAKRESGSLNIKLGLGKDPWTNYLSDELSDFGNNWKENCIEYAHNKEDVTDVRLTVDMGGSDANASFDYIYLKETLDNVATITFQVDMQFESVSAEGVFLTGSFNDWTTPIAMTQDGNTFSTSLELTKGEIIEYKYVNGDTQESISGNCTTDINNNRELIVPDASEVLNLLCFSSCSYCFDTEIFNTNPGVGPVSFYGEMQVNGNRIYGERTQTPVQAKGISLFWSIWGGEKYWNSGAINSLVDKWNIELIRVPMSADDDNGWDFGYLHKNGKKKQIAFMERIVNAAIARDIYVVIDYHSHYAHLNTDNAVGYFNYMAQKYGQYDNVIFEIYNEPATNEWMDIKTYAESVIAEIRKYSDNLIVVGTPFYSMQVDKVLSSPIDDSNSAYVVHFYPPIKQEFRDRSQTVLDNGMALFITEWGNECEPGIEEGRTVEAGFENSDAWHTLLDKYSISSANWSVWAGTSKDNCSLFYDENGNGGKVAYTGDNWDDPLIRTVSGEYVYNMLKEQAETAPWRKAEKQGYTISYNLDGGYNGANPVFYPFNMEEEIVLKNAVKAGYEFDGWYSNSGHTGEVISKIPPGSTSDINLYAKWILPNTLELLSYPNFDFATYGWNHFGEDSVSFQDGVITIQELTDDSGDLVSYVFVNNNQVSFKQGKKYTLSWRAKRASGQIKFQAANFEPWQQFIADQPTFSGDWQENTVVYEHTSETVNGVTFQVLLGGNTSEVSFDYISLKESDIPIEEKKAPFNKGVGFSIAFESGTSVYDIRFQYYTRQDFINVKKLGINQVRLPIYMSNMLDENGIMEPLFFYLLDQYVDMAEEEGVNLILTNMGTYDYENDPSIESQFINVWQQMAEHYKTRSELIHYELANEPTIISDEDWGRIQGNIIDAIRAIDTVHTILVTPPNWSNLKNLQNLPNYEDDNLIYVFHFYDPFFFTHQGAQHVDLDDFYSLPFPYNESEMPSMPSRFAGTWDEIRYNEYETDATEEKIRELVNIAAAFKNERNVRVWCGEFGADDRYSKPEDRTLWYETLRKSLEENGIGWSMLGYTRFWGLFEFGTDKLFDYDLNIPVVEAMGLNTQVQSSFVVAPEIYEFDIYSDYLSSDIDAYITSEDTLSHFYSEDEPYEGKFCIQMKDFPIWNNINFDFKPNKNLSVLVDEEYCLDFWIKGDSPGAKFNMRFFDTKTNEPDDHPWRMVHDIDETLAPWDGKWHHVQIQLSEFYEQGAWDGEWFDPVGKFDWAAIDNFQIQTEYEGFEGKQFWFDNIKIAKRDIVVTKPVKVTFQVDMQNETVSSNVYLRGSFNGWNSTTPLAKNGSIYSTTLEFDAGETIQYKFVNGDEFEEFTGGSCTLTSGQYINRGMEVPGEDVILDLVCFNSCELCESINSYTIVTNANPIEGGFVSGAGTYEDGEAVTLNASSNEGFEFVNWIINGTEASTEKTYSFLASTDVTVIVNFAGLVGFTNAITFQVDMKNESVSAEGVYLKIYLEGEQVRYPFEMEANGSVYSTTVNIISDMPFEYNFVNGNTDNKVNFEKVNGNCSNGEEGHRNIISPKTDSILDIVCFSSCESCPTGIATLNEHLISIYPNPVENNVCISGLSNYPLCDVKLLDVSGKILYLQELINEDEYYIDMTSFPNGNYSLIINTKLGQVVKKLLKQ